MAVLMALNRGDIVNLMMISFQLTCFRVLLHCITSRLRERIIEQDHLTCFTHYSQLTSILDLLNSDEPRVNIIALRDLTFILRHRADSQYKDMNIESKASLKTLYSMCETLSKSSLEEI